MATLLERLTGNVDQSEWGDPNTVEIPVHEMFAFLRIYELDTTLGLTSAQWRAQAVSIFDLSPAQLTQLEGFTAGLDGGKDLHLYEASLLLAQFEKMDGSGISVTIPTLKTLLGLTSD